MALDQAQEFLQPHAFPPDGKALIYLASSGSGFDLHVLTVDSGESRELLSDGFNLIRPSLSPDGRWLAYTSDESGSNQVYVRPFPDLESGRWQVSRGGGMLPKWSPTGRELFYRAVTQARYAPFASAGNMLVVGVDTASTFVPGRPEVLFETDGPNGPPGPHPAVSSDR